MNKKANLKEVLVYTLFALVIFFIIYFSVERIGGQISFWEQVYAKEIVLFIDKAKPRTEIDIDISELIYKARKNKFNGNIVNIDNSKNEVTVKLIEGKGYSINYFSDVDIVWKIEGEKLNMKFLEKS